MCICKREKYIYAIHLEKIYVCIYARTGEGKKTCIYTYIRKTIDHVFLILKLEVSLPLSCGSFLSSLFARVFYVNYILIKKRPYISSDIKRTLKQSDFIVQLKGDHYGYDQTKCNIIY